MKFLDVRYRFDDPEEVGLGESLHDRPPSTDSTRTRLLASAIKITRELLPDLTAGLDDLREWMMVENEIDCFVVADPQVQAYCLPHQENDDEAFTVVLNSGLIERLTVNEMRFVIGHEIGHFLCGHWRYPKEDEHMSLGDRLATLRLSRAAEISADRIGMLACRSLDDACAAMIKVAAGLGAPHLRPDIPSILRQFRELASKDGEQGTVWTTHPVIPLRVRALLRFEPVQRAILRSREWTRQDLKEIDDAIEMDFHRSSGFALKKMADEHLEGVKIWGLVALFCADGVLSKKEQAVMREALGDKTTRKVLGLLKSLGSNIQMGIAKRLAEACDAARMAAKEDRLMAMKELERLVDLAGSRDQECTNLLASTREALDLPTGY